MSALSSAVRIIVTGSRAWPSESAVWDALSFAAIERVAEGGTLTVLHGACRSQLPGARSRSRGTWNCVRAAQVAGIPVEVSRLDFQPEAGLFTNGESR